MPNARALADLGAVVDGGQGMDKKVIRRLRRHRDIHVMHAGPAFEGALPGLKHGQYGQTLAAVGAGVGANRNRLQEVPAFVAQGLGFRQRDRLTGRLARRGLAIDPVDGMRKKRQLLLPRQTIVEHRHRLVADDDKFLLLEGVQPGHIDVGIDAIGEAQVHRGRVGDGWMKVE